MKQLEHNYKSAVMFFGGGSGGQPPIKQATPRDVAIRPRQEIGRQVATASPVFLNI